MHLPAYAHAAIRAALPSVPTARHVDAVDCCLCDRPFADRAAVPLGSTPESGLFGCRDCLTRLVTRARRKRSGALVADAAQSLEDSTVWEAIRRGHLAQLDGVRAGAEAVAELVEDDGAERDDGAEAIDAVRVAWLLLSLESAHAWLPETPEPPSSLAQEDSELRDARFRLNLAMISAREAVASRLAYHIVNEAAPLERELCGELECPEGCAGRHDSSGIDCGPDAIFDDLAALGVTIAPPEETPAPHPHGPRKATESAMEGRFASYEEGSLALLAHFGLDMDDEDALLDAAAVGLVFDAWRDGPLDEIHASPDGPGDGEVFAQSVDLYRRARVALAAVRDDAPAAPGAEPDIPDALAAFVSVASDMPLPWAGGSGFRLASVSGAAAEFLPEFVRQVDDRVRFTSEVMREQGWRTALLHRAMTAAVRCPEHFGMPAWPGVVATAMPRLAALDRSDAPEALHDLNTVEAALLEAPDSLGAAALGWLADSAVLLGGPAVDGKARS
ncbi:hypothetical protein [Streptomyces venezuelae]|uniref:hypothetical protein n=1 Tax=Streptomyces venezuelae TaxID=54571 RepID=UPI00363B5775